jgi:hypothetical protein
VDNGEKGVRDLKTKPERDNYARDTATEIRVAMETHLTNLRIMTCLISDCSFIIFQ